MASGLPVIDSRYNGGSELIVEGEQLDSPIRWISATWRASCRWHGRPAIVARPWATVPGKRPSGSALKTWWRGAGQPSRIVRSR